MYRISINAGLYQLLVNALQRDAEDGKQSRKEILEELQKDAQRLESDKRVVVPDELSGYDARNVEYMNGWNDCRDSVLSNIQQRK